MSRTDIVWHGRACVWIGVALLLLMAFTGGQVGLVSVIAVVAVFVGIALLLCAIPLRVGQAHSRPIEKDTDV